MTRSSSPLDPRTPAEWQEAVDAAAFWLLLDGSRQYGLVTFDTIIDVPRCKQILREGHARDVVPTAPLKDPAEAT